MLRDGDVGFQIFVIKALDYHTVLIEEEIPVIDEKALSLW